VVPLLSSFARIRVIRGQSPFVSAEGDWTRSPLKRSRLRLAVKQSDGDDFENTPTAMTNPSRFAHNSGKISKIVALRDEE